MKHSKLFVVVCLAALLAGFTLGSDSARWTRVAIVGNRSPAEEEERASGRDGLRRPSSIQHRATSAPATPDLELQRYR